MKHHYRKARRKDALIPMITLTPLIDTVLVLLVIFMVTTPSKTPLPSLTQNRPKEKTQPSNKHYKTLVVYINNNDSVFLDGICIQADQLKNAIVNGIEKSPIKTARIFAEPSASSQCIQQIIDIIRHIQGAKIVFW